MPRKSAKRAAEGVLPVPAGYDDVRRNKVLPFRGAETTTFQTCSAGKQRLV
jgi:hypothetical protein